MKTFDDFKIDLGGRSGVEVQATCPQCSHTRKKPKARCLSVNTVEGVWCCHHCDWRGTLKGGEESRSQPPRRLVRPRFEKPSTVPPVLCDWFAGRGISEAIVERFDGTPEPVVAERDMGGMVAYALLNCRSANVEIARVHFGEQGRMLLNQLAEAGLMIVGVSDAS